MVVENIFYDFAIKSLWELLIPRVWPIQAQSLIGSIYIGEHYT